MTVLTLLYASHSVSETLLVFAEQQKSTYHHIIIKSLPTDLYYFKIVVVHIMTICAWSQSAQNLSSTYVCQYEKFGKHITLLLPACSLT